MLYCNFDFKSVPHFGEVLMLLHANIVWREDEYLGGLMVCLCYFYFSPFATKKIAAAITCNNDLP